MYFITGLMESICNEGRVSFSEVLCYGIGHVGMCQTAQHQVALLVAMIEEWKVTSCVPRLRGRSSKFISYQPPHTWVFDPVLQPEEIRALEAFGLEIISKNEVSRCYELNDVIPYRLAGEQLTSKR